ncbi:MAG: glycosyltransferase [Dictyoglomaceae bacterium]
MELIIGQFNDSYPPIMDGVANVVRNYAYFLNKKYATTYVITPSYPNYKDDEEFEVIRYFSIPLILRPPYRLGIPFFDLSAMKKIKKIPFSIVHAHSPFSSGLLALKIARERKIPIVATFHTKYYDDFKSATKSDLLAKIGTRIIVEFYYQVDEVWTVNLATAQTLREYGFKGRIGIVPNGCDFIPPSNLEEYKKKIDEIYNLTSKETVFLYVGQLISQKNLELLIYSLKYLKDVGINFKMFIVGTGKEEGYFKELVKKLNLDKLIIFTGKILDRELLKSFYARADLFLFPSLYDTSGIVVQEASSMKCPSLLIEGASASEGIIDNFNGFLSKNDPILYAKKIKEIISDRENLKRVGENAQRTIYKDWESIIDEVAERYKEIIKNYKLKGNI